MRALSVLAYCAFLAGTPTIASAAVIYTYQDGLGTTDTVSVDGIGPGDAWWANQFNTAVGGESIISLTLGYGPNIANLPISFLLYDDPNGNGLPDDIVLLGRVDTTLGAFSPNPGEVNSFNTTAFASPIQVGSSFFAAVILFNAQANANARADITNTHGRSWFGGTSTANTFDPANPNLAELPPTNLLTFGADVDFYLDANGVPGNPASVPEPGTALLLGIGLAAALLRRAN